MNPKILILFACFVTVLTSFGCVNVAAENLAEDCWELREPLILENNKFTQIERELLFIEVMQAKGFSDEEIADKIENLQTRQSEEE